MHFETTVLVGKFCTNTSIRQDNLLAKSQGLEPTSCLFSSVVANRRKPGYKPGSHLS